MLQEILRDQAIVLRSLADELDSVADTIAREAQLPSSVRPVMDSGLVSYQPTRPVEDNSASDVSIAVPDGRVDSIYNMDAAASERINFEASLNMARHEARQGKVVKLDFGSSLPAFFLTKDNWDAPVALFGHGAI